VNDNTSFRQVCLLLGLPASQAALGHQDQVLQYPTSTPAAAHSTGPIEEEVLEEIIVYGRSLQTIGAPQSASEGLVGYDDIALLPKLPVGKLVEVVPGLVATQHSGTGKANQYFVRGFNLDHGTDFSVKIGSVPVNLCSHVHLFRIAGDSLALLNFVNPLRAPRQAQQNSELPTGGR